MYQAEKHGEGIKAKPATPGLKYRHYSPRAKVVLVEYNQDEDWVTKKVEDVIRKEEVKTIGFIRTRESAVEFDANKKIVQLSLGNWKSGEEAQHAIARGLFGALRELDEKGCETILMEGVPEENRGAAVMNRIRKAAAVIVKKSGEEKNHDA
jgi:L-threonylcarbamoyladenylate synthase